MLERGVGKALYIGTNMSTLDKKHEELYDQRVRVDINNEASGKRGEQSPGRVCEEGEGEVPNLVEHGCAETFQLQAFLRVAQRCRSEITIRIEQGLSSYTGVHARACFKLPC